MLENKKGDRWLQRKKMLMRKNPTKEEKIFGDALKTNNIKFRWQSLCYTKEFQCIVDFFIKSDGQKIAIEIDGNYHLSKEQIEKDTYRTQWLKEKRGYDVIRFTNKQVNEDINLCLITLADYYICKVQDSPSNNFKSFIKIINLPINQHCYA